jgi:hypothetical protein
MCRIERKCGGGGGEKDKETMGVVKGVEKIRSSISRPSSKMKLWMIRATTSVLLWTCVVQLTTIGEMWGPRVLKGWPSCWPPQSVSAALQENVPTVPARVLPPKSQSFLVISDLFICLLRI